MRGRGLVTVIEKAAGTDLEAWVYRLLKDNHCLFDGRPAKHWYQAMGIGPLVDGLHLTEHYNINKNLRAFEALEDSGYTLGDPVLPALSGHSLGEA